MQNISFTLKKIKIIITIWYIVNNLEINGLLYVNVIKYSRIFIIIQLNQKDIQQLLSWNRNVFTYTIGINYDWYLFNIKKFLFKRKI
jgi:hypothetical protein